MIISFLTGAILGFLLAIPPGPVGVSVIRIALKDDRRGGILVGIGASLMDVLYCLFAMLFTSAFFSTLEYFFVTYPFAMLLFQGICVAGMVLFGLMQFRNPKQINPQASSCAGIEPPAPRLSAFRRLIQKMQHHGPFFLGVGIALTNIANPTFLPSLAYTSMFVQHQHLVEISTAGSLGFSIGFGAGNFGWMYLLLRLIMHFKARFSSEFTLRIQRFAGLTMIGVGTYLGYRVILVTKWAEILRLLFAF
jgi:threonine/homoserine/homoserine lactone efflux protein